MNVYFDMNNWIVLYYSDEEGNCSVKDFIKSNSKRNRAKIINQIALLEEMGPILPRPYSDLLKDGIHELRIKLSGDQVRILYFFCYKQYIILTNWFIKKTDKVPSSEIKKAKKLRDDFLVRYDEEKIQKELFDGNVS
jgi:phage-related protein